MKTKTIVIIGAILLGVILFSVFQLNSSKSKKAVNLPPGTHKCTISEVIQTTKYTYFLVEENDAEIWIAVTKRDASKGDVIYYTNPLEMKNFVSKELNRTFPIIYFVQDVSDKPVTEANQAPMEKAAQKAEVIKKEGIKIELEKGAISIAQLYENSEKYAGKTVKIRGEITRYNSMVMGKNWAHLQDGTEFSGQFDLAVTTMDKVAVGNQVTFTGVISLNKDFGAGYFYKIIMEEAVAADIK